MEKFNKIFKKILIILTVITAVLLVVLYGGKFYIESKIKEKLDAKIVSLKDVADISYRDVNLDVWKRKLIIENIKIKPLDSRKEVTIKDIVVKSYDVKNRIPKYADIYFEGVEFPISLLPEEEKVISNLLGFKGNFYTNVHLSYFYDNKTGEFYLKDFSQSIPGFADIKLSCHLGNLFFSDGILPLLLYEWKNVIFYEGKFIFKDRGLTNRMISFLAREKGISVKDVKKKAVERLERRLNSVKDKSSQMIIKALKTFIENPNTLYIEAKPKIPVPLGKILSVKSNEDLISLFNIYVKAE